jgi:indole-3-glycerol phosphate synthase
VPAVIAEVKRASPSAGVIADLHPADTAAAYAANGAAAISVLTEERHFGGALTHLEAVSARVSVPTLRKDFVVHPRQLDEAVAAGAAAVLLMVSVLADALPDYLRATELLGLDALVEVHDEAELALALAAGASIIGVNNRDLRTLDIDLMLAPRLIAAGRRQRPDAVWVAESGYREASAVADLVGTADAVLIGSQLAGAASPGGALAELLATARALAERSTQ